MCSRTTTFAPVSAATPSGTAFGWKTAQRTAGIDRALIASTTERTWEGEGGMPGFASSRRSQAMWNRSSR